MLFNQKNKINISNFIMPDWIWKGETKPEQDRHLYLSDGFNDKERAVCVTNGRQTETGALQSVHIHHAMETFSPERVVLWSILTPMLQLCVPIMYSSATLLSRSSRLESANVNDLFQCIQLQEIVKGLCLLLLYQLFMR